MISTSPPLDAQRLNDRNREQRLAIGITIRIIFLTSTFEELFSSRPRSVASHSTDDTSIDSPSHSVAQPKRASDRRLNPPRSGSERSGDRAPGAVKMSVPSARHRSLLITSSRPVPGRTGHEETEIPGRQRSREDRGPRKTEVSGRDRRLPGFSDPGSRRARTLPDLESSRHSSSCRVR